MSNQDSGSLNLLSGTTAIQTITETIAKAQNIQIADVANLQNQLNSINTNISNVNTTVNSTNETVASNNNFNKLYIIKRSNLKL